MFSKKIIWAFLFIFIFLSITALLENMPAPKNKRVYEAILPYFPYKITKELGGVDIVDKRTGKDLDIANAQVYLAYDAMLKKWGEKHLKVEGDKLHILDDNGTVIKTLSLNQKELAWVKEFFKK
ncbi:hypothetical protein NitYY0826_C1955 [Nitratiruptor sp. YY08-26]|uniref:hypothetical protein n=1 Tax=unclassified Nitratiruptor TaxID=2624044 RepID=UPI001915E134|nr:MULTISPECIES: hypothetical protein [unclassified Nitratiruptor]BCD63065.1 hypothetical protein NitYY0813_C1953 [Nitratiruptor sp. YY08-13]BCD67000.1 hypothetical protein NitYY0826_C1955 [Nitratiruptor sp. YY08-26]